MGSTWAVDLKDIGAVYPLLGWEVIMVVVAIALWILWHIVQIRQENQDYADDIKRYGSKESIKKALDDHPV
jgi:flagellar biosynthesis regulator FlaF